MLGYRKKLDMSVSHFLNIRNKSVGKLTVVERVAVFVRLPGACVNFIDINGRCIDIGVLSLPEPRLICPSEIKLTVIL